MERNSWTFGFAMLLFGVVIGLSLGGLLGHGGTNKAHGSEEDNTIIPDVTDNITSITFPEPLETILNYSSPVNASEILPDKCQLKSEITMDDFSDINTTQEWEAFQPLAYEVLGCKTVGDALAAGYTMDEINQDLLMRLPL